MKDDKGASKVSSCAAVLIEELWFRLLLVTGGGHQGCL